MVEYVAQFNVFDAWWIDMTADVDGGIRGMIQCI